MPQMNSIKHANCQRRPQVTQILQTSVYLHGGAKFCTKVKKNNTFGIEINPIIEYEKNTCNCISKPYSD